MLILRRKIVLVQHLVSSLSLGECSDHRLRVLSNLWSEQSPKESDDTRCCTNTIVMKMSKTVLETSTEV